MHSDLKPRGTMVKEFIEGWDLLQVLGEGTFAEVKLLVNRDTGEACAMKEVNLRNHPEAKDVVKKEIGIHKLLKHRNIVRCYGSRVEDCRQFIFLEYCNGGELFDRIEPEVGMPEHQAQNYFAQLINGLDYLHKRGVAHRDIKPENLLLNDQDILKISDFGMATVFRHKGIERQLERKCGTMPYIAPEILIRPKYGAEPADIWSCGVVLVGMLSGELPWNQPTPDQREYVAWKEQDYTTLPWKRIDNLPLSLLRKILCPQTSRRYSLAQIKNHIWMKKKFRDSKGNLISPVLVSPPLKRVCPASSSSQEDERGCASQPAAAFNIPESSPSLDGNDCGDEVAKFQAFSQPAQPSNLICSTQSGTQTQSSQTRFQRLVKRFTRFWVVKEARATEDFMKEVFFKMGYGCKMHTAGILTIETEDRRGSVLIFKCIIIEVDKKILVDFRLSRGCGLDFKWHFAKIKKNMEPILEKSPGPILWPELIPVEAIPGIPT